MRVILLGPPGAGKGTQAQFISERFHIPKISTGDMLRSAIQAKTALGMEVKKTMEAGKLVPDNTMIVLVKERITQPDCAKGFLLDGFPRTIVQANALRDAKVYIDKVIEIDVPDGNIIDRMTGRMVHPSSGRIYHRTFNPPKVTGQDDITGEPLIHREDDSEQTVCERLSVYHRQTQPLVAYYREWAQSGDLEAPEYHSISGVGPLSVVFERIADSLSLKNSYKGASDELN